MEYIRTEENGQLVIEKTSGFLQIPSCLHGFENTATTSETAKSGRAVFCFRGRLSINEEARRCPSCGKRMHINTHADVTLRHLCIGGNLSCVTVPHYQFKCPACSRDR